MHAVRFSKITFKIGLWWSSDQRCCLLTIFGSNHGEVYTYYSIKLLQTNENNKIIFLKLPISNEQNFKIFQKCNFAKLGPYLEEKNLVWVALKLATLDHEFWTIILSLSLSPSLSKLSFLTLIICLPSFNNLSLSLTRLCFR